MKRKFNTKEGMASPLGTSYSSDGVNFALFSHHATAVSLCLFPPGIKESIEIRLDPKMNKTGDIWHVCIANLPADYRYGYRIDGPYQPKKGHFFDNRNILLDPYAKWLDAPTQWQERQESYLAFVGPIPPFDWEGDLNPHHSMEDLIIYEMHVRGFSQDPSSNAQNKGGFLGVIEKIPYLKELGVNAVELLPVHEFQEWDSPFVNPETGEQLCNYWGYSTVNFFAPMRRYGTIEDFKTMVKALHKAKIEVILDVVYNHTAEGSIEGPTLSFRGIENTTYYMVHQESGNYYNFSGCGNTVFCNHPIVRDLIRDSLRYWVEEMHVDGFRFDLASILTRDFDGTPLSNPPVVEEIGRDPVLAKTKLIAEAWDAGGLYQVGQFPHHNKWSEWNGKYRDEIRRFLKGTDGQVGLFSTRLCGSEDLYSHLSPSHSINFLTAHDGFSLADLVSYNEKHNACNGEENRDGDDNNESWNCGEEGETSDSKVLSLRKRQMKNFLLTLFLSQGVPMLLMGDEYGHSKLGNNNTWGHDSRLNWFQWDTLEQNREIYQFTRKMIEIRQHYPILNRATFLHKNEIEFHGPNLEEPSWEESCRFLSYTLIDRVGSYRLYVAFNASHKGVHVHFPKLHTGRWEMMIDTNLVKQPSHPKAIAAYDRRMPPYSAIVLLAQTPHGS